MVLVLIVFSNMVLVLIVFLMRHVSASYIQLLVSVATDVIENEELKSDISNNRHVTNRDARSDIFNPVTTGNYCDNLYVFIPLN